LKRKKHQSYLVKKEVCVLRKTSPTTDKVRNRSR